MTEGTPCQLWQVQLNYWPESVRLTPQDVLLWAAEPLSPERQARRFRAVAFSIQYPNGVWYRTKPEGGYMGYRFGLEGPDYLSNFNDL